jgi:outer membrane protein assembly factor BamB
MTISKADEPTSRKPLRLWPGVAIVILQWLARFVIPALMPEAVLFAVLGGVVGGLAIVGWWVFLSRAPWSERLGAVALMAAALFATSRLVDPSIATGAMGWLLLILAVPVLSLAFVAWAVATRHSSSGVRRATMVATILLACGAWTLVRTDGFTGNFHNELAWRWTRTSEERLLTQEGGKPAALPAAPAEPKTGAEWPGFRGPHRDGLVAGVRIDTNWSSSPPVQLWRQPIGPGWSSFAVHADLFYTQEQRGEEEVVACYQVSTGKPVWRHQDRTRFWESNAGAGPRATPTLHHGRVYALGGTGTLNALDARTGAVVWTRNAASDTGAKLPLWGFSGSPLVVGDDVVVAASGALVAYDLGTGAVHWLGPKAGDGYSSPQLMTIHGVTQVLQLNGAGVTSVTPAEGKVLWEHRWKGYPIVQPALTADGDVLISVSDRSGTRRLAIAGGTGGWTVEERWTSSGLKPYFNDFVVHQGHAFGFDGSLLACIDVADGRRTWKGGRYGHGQLVLLPDQNLLLVLSERGELVLVRASPDEFIELARFPGLEGKTWNHPVLVGDVLLVRNSQEMAAFRLSPARR